MASSKEKTYKNPAYGHTSNFQPESNLKSQTKLDIGNDDFEENFIRRQKRRKIETRKEIDKMRSELPEYGRSDIRMFKLPFYQALSLQLEDTGYMNTEAYLEQLFQLNEKMRNEAGPNSFLWNLPLLKHSDNELRKLSDALMKAEDQYNQGNHRMETEILLAASVDFAFKYQDWFWLAEELILQCISNANKYKITGKHEAISRYIHAKMLIEKVREYDKAEKELSIARELSTGKSWNAKAFLPGQSSYDTLFMNANHLLHLCYMRLAKHWLKTDQNKALEFATLAKKRATEACYRDGETMALFLKGQCELNLGNTKDAVSTFIKAYYIQSKLKSQKGMCEARVELSKAYLMHGNARLALSTLLALKEMAEEQGFQFYLAQAYRYLGEFYLNCGEPYKATPLLSNALEIFHCTGNMSEADQVRNLGALSSATYLMEFMSGKRDYYCDTIFYFNGFCCDTGLELMPQYVMLLQRTGRRYPDWFDNLIKLLKWKDSRDPFWSGNVEKASESANNLLQPVASTEWADYLQISDDNSIDMDIEHLENGEFCGTKDQKNAITLPSLEEEPKDFELIIAEPQEEVETDNIHYT